MWNQFLCTTCDVIFKLATNLCRRTRSFKPYPNERHSVQQTRDKRQKIPLKIPLPTRTSFKIISRSSGCSQKRFFLKWSAVNAQQKKMNGERRVKVTQRRESERWKSKEQWNISSHNFAFCACPSFQRWNLTPETKAVLSTCRRRFGQSGFVFATQWPQNGSTAFKQR